MEHVAIEPTMREVEEVLEEVLAGNAFRSSPQCQALLRYIVKHSVAHENEMLRERLIGIHVFGRAPDYDTGSDPVVRSRAAEVRKRLARHYMQRAAGSHPFRIEIPSGSYRANFEPVEYHQGAANQTRFETAAPPELRAMDERPAVESMPRSGVGVEHLLKTGSGFVQVQRSTLVRWGGSVLIGLLLVGAAVVAKQETDRARLRLFEAFWSPFVSGRPPIIFIGANHAYLLSSTFLNQYSAEHRIDNNAQGVEFFINLEKGEKLDQGDLVPTKLFTGFGDVAAVARIASMLEGSGHGYDLRYGDNITVSDLQSSPTILIGGFNNPWTLELMHQLPFRLIAGDRIVDSEDAKHVWKTRKSEPGNMRGDDYAVIARIIKAETGNVVLDIAGIDTYSNQAAADFLADPTRLTSFLKSLPRGWESQNLQIVLHSTVVAGVPAVVNMEAVRTW